jgi:hypothetical protein
LILCIESADSDTLPPENPVAEGGVTPREWAVDSSRVWKEWRAPPLTPRSNAARLHGRPCGDGGVVQYMGGSMSGAQRVCLNLNATINDGMVL